MASINDLQNDPKNARKRTDRSAKLIKQSLEQYGAARSIVIDENNRILAGNGTIAGAKAAGIKNIKIIEADGDEIIAVKRSNLTEDQKVGLAIADNRTGDLSEWNIDMLEQLSREHDLNDFFDKKELDDILSKKEVLPTEGLTDPDDVPEVPEEPITKKGDLYILGNHSLLCGDSTNIQHVEKLMDGNKVDAIITDPPYGLGIDGQKKSVCVNPKHNRKAHEFRGWDNKRPDKDIFNYILSLNVPTLIWGGNYFADMLPASRGWIYWSKGQDGLTMSDGELAWTNLNKVLRSITLNRSVLKGSVHPTQKPVELIIFCMNYLESHKILLDLYAGSGTTLIAAERTNRHAYLMELDPKYCDVIVKRWEDFTGNTAKRVSSS